MVYGNILADLYNNIEYLQYNEGLYYLPICVLSFSVIRQNYFVYDLHYPYFVNNVRDLSDIL